MSSSDSVPTVTLVVRDGKVYFVPDNDTKNTFDHPLDKHHQEGFQNNEQRSGSAPEDDDENDSDDCLESTDFVDELLAALCDDH